MNAMKDAILQAAQLIKSGDLVAFPTETVYGLGADATNDIACKKIYDTKNRPTINPLIVHVNSLEEAQNIACFNDMAINIAEIFWPGPLTIILKKEQQNLSNIKISPIASAGLETIAIRIPAHPIARELIDASGVPIAAPSANRSGKISATNSWHVKKQFGNQIFILEDIWNERKYGIESTIIDLSTTVPQILRHGIITREMIENVIGNVKILDRSVHDVIKSPGMLLKHYSPETKIRLGACNVGVQEIALDFGDSNLSQGNSNIFALNLSKDGDCVEAAANLFDFLYILDEFALSNSILSIAVAPIPQHGVGIAINDKLYRATN